MGIIWTILIGFVAGVIAKLVTPGSNEPSGFILTTVLGIVGAFVASWLGQALGWYGPGEGAGLIGAVVGAIIVLLIWGAGYAAADARPNLIAIEGSGCPSRPTVTSTSIEVRETPISWATYCRALQKQPSIEADMCSAKQHVRFTPESAR